VNLGQRIYRSIRSFIAPRSRSAFGAMPYTEFTFAALGRVAKAAGVVQPAHIEVAQRLMQDLGFGATDRRHAIRCFAAGKNPAFDLAPLARACRETANDRDVLNELALESLCTMAWAIGAPSADSSSELTRTAGLLGIDAPAVHAAEQRVAEFRRRQMPLALRQAYLLLGVDHRADDTELKLAYRRLMSRHHPDKFAADPDPEQARHASENSAAIRSAFELIRASRTDV
jgi:DnaJ like chaperone protein